MISYQNHGENMNRQVKLRNKGFGCNRNIEENLILRKLKNTNRNTYH
jgi:hypothetical protein